MICNTPLSSKTNVLQEALVDSCYAPNLLVNGFGPWNPCPVSALEPAASIYVDFQVVGPCLGTLSEIRGKKAKVDFSGFSADIADTISLSPLLAAILNQFHSFLPPNSHPHQFPINHFPHHHSHHHSIRQCQRCSVWVPRYTCLQHITFSSPQIALPWSKAWQWKI